MIDKNKIPPELQSSCKCVPIDPDWPISGPLEALELLEEWEQLEGGPEPLTAEHISRNLIGGHIQMLTHSHHYEYADLKRFGVEQLYQKSRSTKYVSIGWHLAGRYEYDVALIAELECLGWPSVKLIDFGAACWIQAIFYANKGLQVDIVNQTLDSDCNRFGRWLAQKKGLLGRINEYSSKDIDQIGEYDIIYAMDVFEHIPPLEDGTPGWIPVATRLLKALKPGGIWQVNSPFGEESGVPHPVSSHEVHYTSPISQSEWNVQQGLVQEGYLWRKPPL